MQISESINILIHEITLYTGKPEYNPEDGSTTTTSYGTHPIADAYIGYKLGAGALALALASRKKKQQTKILNMDKPKATNANK